MATKSEFSVQGAYHYNHRSPIRWLWSHAWRYKHLVLGAGLLYIVCHIAFSLAPVMIGRAAEEFVNPSGPNGMLWAALRVLIVLTIDATTILSAAYVMENIAKRVEADAREELYASLLGKSQTFHNRQRTGDIMARATDDVSQLSSMIMPGLSLSIEAVLAFIVPLIYITLIHPPMLLVPLLFVFICGLTIRAYSKSLGPVARAQREQFGTLNSGLEETVSGIEVVKATAQEAFERQKYLRNAGRFRELFVKQGFLEARYLPLLLFGLALGLTFLHATYLYRQGTLSLGEVISIMGLMNILRFPTFISIFTFSLIQLGLAAARRILEIIQAETELDENQGGSMGPVRGEIIFNDVSFSYEGKSVLNGVSFHIRPGQTVAIVGQTGSGKSTLAQLVNRTYDADSGQIIIDGADVREWNLDALRSGISKIEQDIFLFSRSIAENIAFGRPGATQAEIETAAREAQAHDFISSFAEGYATVIGERGVTLSGGQRQRLALARAFLSNPSILILDDSTSAIDSATEDEIQKAIRRAQQGRTTLMITHRLAQIRWADLILVLDGGQVVAQGDHETLLRRSPHYRRIFARYDAALPPLEGEGAVGGLQPESAMVGAHANP